MAPPCAEPVASSDAEPASGAAQASGAPWDENLNDLDIITMVYGATVPKTSGAAPKTSDTAPPTAVVQQPKTSGAVVQQPKTSGAAPKTSATAPPTVVVQQPKTSGAAPKTSATAPPTAVVQQRVYYRRQDIGEANSERELRRASSRQAKAKVVLGRIRQQASAKPIVVPALPPRNWYA